MLRYAVFAAALLATPVGAVTLYDEAISGDLATRNSEAINLGQLVEGINTFRGSLSADCVENGGDRPDCAENLFQDSVDSFRFTANTDREITSITYTFTNGNAPDGTTVGFSLSRIDAGTRNGLATGQSLLDVSTTSTQGLPVAGAELVINVRGESAPFEASFETDWQIDVTTVALVPVPASLPLLAVGLGAFGWLRRKT